jgi:hypothetical protein
VDAGFEDFELGTRFDAVVLPAGSFQLIFAGGVVVSSRMKVLATGAMVALAIIPSMALIGMGLAMGNLELALGAFGRWSVEVGCLILGDGSIMVLKWTLLHRRRLAHG